MCPALLDQSQAAQIVLCPFDLMFEHDGEGAQWESVGGAVYRDRYGPPVFVYVTVVRADGA